MITSTLPQPVRQRHRRSVLFVVLLALVTYLALRPANPQVVVEGWDKVNHLLAFLVLAAVGVAAMPAPAPWAERWTAFWLLAYGAWIEWAQTLTATRQAEFLDWVADAVGILIGLALARWLGARRRRRANRANEPA